MSGRPIVVVGDVLLDRDVTGEAGRLAPDAPVPVVDVASERCRPGGAGLAAALAARDGREVVLVTALGRDEASETVRALLPAGVRLAELPLDGTLPVKCRVLAGDRPLMRMDHGGGVPGPPGRAALAALDEAGAVLVADYGLGTAAAVRAALLRAAGRVPVVWDPHPRGEPPVAGVRMATPNEREARWFLRHHRAASEGAVEDADDSLRAHSRRGSLLAERWQSLSVAVTLGERGAVLARAHCDDPLYLPVDACGEGDPCGAGDCFAATATTVFADGGLPPEAADLATQAAAAFVTQDGARRGFWYSESRPAAAPGPDGARVDKPRRLDEITALADRVRARGGTVVAAGGCFDLLHAGHVQFLENARRTGDLLIVCVNSDASVRRLKGPGRPLNHAADRIRVLAGLGCVDAVAEFDEDTPQRLLRALRPDIWVKGGDYSVRDLPEAAELREWNGQTLVLPYLDGRSTTDLARRAARCRS
ncbi:D-glycero-beta-D-manno-heptose 1-phosphate adenylyltransferase [Streptomyces millisiae]|uniref:D-glycero-beta-D-manno-heptose 1-phosphate adenylyltransferase n=1 Tax=Streptomyces millisiae TaxID=3075542 RepID=A0ABU2LJE8_9ACTN|nr:D-glycero-beta-D-manno-heptose 1-phosphate adenylyltransferase [Streptomyces sp. DSM 44918]MDT0317397.1 D-glycero-beta-D-manno-heptose 1-phosphate adenylyltransferase [Streptomyces sp. DSM 44918]